MARFEEKITTPRADFKALLLQAGAHGWTREQALCHLKETLDTQPVRKALAKLFPEIIARTFGMLPYTRWETNWVSFMERYTHRPCAPYYIRGTQNRWLIHQRLPYEAECLVRRILRIQPDTRFQVSFIGEDPVLWAVSGEYESSCKTPHPAAEPVCIWLGHGRYAKMIMPPR